MSAEDLADLFIHLVLVTVVTYVVSSILIESGLHL